MNWPQFKDALHHLVQEGTLPEGLTPEGVLEALYELGFPHKEELDDVTMESLGGYTWSARLTGLQNVLKDRLAEFQSFVDEIAVEYGDKLQPSEAKGLRKIGLRRLWWDIICFAYGAMSVEHFYDHVNWAAFNGRIYEVEKKDTKEMVLVISPVTKKQQMPASYPSNYPDRLAGFLERYAPKQLPS